MPKVDVVFWQGRRGKVPVLSWLDDLEVTDARGYAKCITKIELLAARGHELRRPHPDAIRDGIRELRASYGGLQYRILYFFSGRGTVVLVHGIKKKQSEVPESDIVRAKERMEAFMADPSKHTHKE